MSPTELKYEVLSWTKINPKPVTEDILTYLERAAEFFYDYGHQDGYREGLGDYTKYAIPDTK